MHRPYSTTRPMSPIEWLRATRLPLNKGVGGWPSLRACVPWCLRASLALRARADHVRIRRPAVGIHARRNVAEPEIHTEHGRGDLAEGISRLAGQQASRLDRRARRISELIHQCRHVGNIRLHGRVGGIVRTSYVAPARRARVPLLLSSVLRRVCDAPVEPRNSIRAAPQKNFPRATSIPFRTCAASFTSRKELL